MDGFLNALDILKVKWGAVLLNLHIFIFSWNVWMYPHSRLIHKVTGKCF